MKPTTGGSICSSGTLVTVGVGIMINISHPVDGRQWRKGATDYYIRLNTGTPLSGIQTLASSIVPTSIKWAQNFVQFWVPDYTAWLYTNFGSSTIVQGGSALTAYQFWKHPDGGVVLLVSNAKGYVGYNPARDEITDYLVDLTTYHSRDPTTAISIIAWNTTPELPPVYYAGYLSGPSKPGRPSGVVNGSLYQATYTYSSDAGVPAASYFIRCVPPDMPCTDLRRTSGTVAGTKGSVYGLIPGWTYWCYVTAINIVSEVCSDPSEVYAPSLSSLTTYTIGLPNGTTFKHWPGESTGQVRTANGTELSFVLFDGAELGTTANSAAFVALGAGTGGATAMLTGVNNFYLSVWTSPSFLHLFKFYRWSANHYGVYVTNNGDYWNYLPAADAIQYSSQGTPRYDYINWTIIPDPPAKYIVGNYSACDPPFPPAAGTISDSFWRTSFLRPTNMGLPTAVWTVVCVAAGDPCTATPVFQGSFNNEGYILTTATLTFNASFDCYSQGKNAIATVCSTTPTRVVIPARDEGRQVYVLAGSNNETLYRYSNSFLSATPDAGSKPFTLVFSYCSWGTCLSGGYTYLVDPTPNTTATILGGPYGAGYAFVAGYFRPCQFWPHPAGGYFIYDTWDGTFWREKSPSTAFWRFQITPAPPANVTNRTLAYPDPPSAPTAGYVSSFTSWTSTWTLPGSIGVPNPTARLRCVSLGSICTNATRWESPVVAITVYTATVSSLTAGGRQYSCFVVLTHALGQVCSTDKVDILVP